MSYERNCNKNLIRVTFTPNAGSSPSNEFFEIHTDTLCCCIIYGSFQIIPCVCVYHMFCMVIEKLASPSQINRVEFIFSLKCEV